MKSLDAALVGRILYFDHPAKLPLYALRLLAAQMALTTFRPQNLAVFCNLEAFSRCLVCLYLVLLAHFSYLTQKSPEGLCPLTHSIVLFSWKERY